MKLNLDSLNENQRTAVEWNEGPLLVLAGPGSGKTRVLTMRIAQLLLDSPGRRFRVLGLTFTNKAAAEMRNRVDELVPDAGERALLTTFHSFCADILRQHGNHIGLKPDFTILTQDADREAVLSDAIDKLMKDSVISVSSEDIKLLPVIERLLSNCVPDEDVVSLMDEQYGEKVAGLFAEYKKQLVLNNSLDFSSILNQAHKLLTDKHVIAKQIKTMYPHVCVDEFQDTNLAQYLILKDIIGDNASKLFVVADDDQIIYQWNGASPERLIALRDEYDMVIIQLPANYRCPNEVIVLANKLIQYNLERAVDKEPLYSMKKGSSKDSVRVKDNFKSVEEELAWVASDISEIHRDEPGNCAVLGRTRKLLELAVLELEKAGLTAAFSIRKSEFLSAPFRWLHAMLRLANGRSDREQLRRTCKAFYELEGVDLKVKEIVASSAKYGGDYLKSWFEAASNREGVETNTLKFLEEISNKLADKLDYLGFINIALKWFSEQEQKMGVVSEEGFVDYKDEISAWADLQQQIMSKYGGEDRGLNTFLQELDLSEKSTPIPSNAVRCLTIHSSKGMEFEHVYLVGLVEDQLPSFQSIKKGDNSREMQEERRNCFVAITRAQSSLTITYADNYFGWAKKPSRFLREMELL